MDFSLISVIIGYLGSFLVILSFLYQIYTIYQNKSAKDISFIFIYLQLIVNIMFTIYDISILSYPLLMGNGTASLLLIIILTQKYFYSIKRYDNIDDF